MSQTTSSTVPDREEALDLAMQAFREHGYEGASIQVLVDRTGLHRANLYSAFRSKADLFLAALERYSNVRLEQVNALLAAGDPLEQIEALIRAQVTPSPDGEAATCLVLRTTLGQGYAVPGVPERVHQFHDGMKGALAGAIRNAQQSGKADATRDADLMAEMLLVCLKGLCGARVCEAPEDRREAAIGEVLRTLKP